MNFNGVEIVNHNILIPAAEATGKTANEIFEMAARRLAAAHSEELKRYYLIGAEQCSMTTSDDGYLVSVAFHDGNNPTLLVSDLLELLPGEYGGQREPQFGQYRAAAPVIVPAQWDAIARGSFDGPHVGIHHMVQIALVDQINETLAAAGSELRVFSMGVDKSTYGRLGACRGGDLIVDGEGDAEKAALIDEVPAEFQKLGIDLQVLIARAYASFEKNAVWLLHRIWKVLADEPVWTPEHLEAIAEVLGANSLPDSDVAGEEDAGDWPGLAEKPF